MRSDGVRRLVLADDREVAGTALGDRLPRLARRAGIEVVDRERLSPDDDLDDGVEVPKGLGREVASEKADAFLYTGTYRPFAVEVLKTVHRENPGVGLYGGDDLALAPDLPASAGAAGRNLTLTGVDPPTGAEASRFRRAFEREYATTPHPQAVLGYEAMRSVLRAVEAAGPDAKSRRRVIREALGGAGNPPAQFALFRVQGNRLVPVGSRR